MNEFAPEYSKKEKVLLMLKHIAWAIPLILIAKLVFFPWFENYVNNAHCYKYGNITGTEVVFYGLLVGLPLSLVGLLLLLEGSNCIRILQLAQSPLPGEKVFKPTKYVYGFRAKLKPLFIFIVLVLLVGLSINGIYLAKKIIGKVNPEKVPACKVS